MILMATGATEQIDALISMLRKFAIIEMVRTGKVVMIRGQGST